MSRKLILAPAPQWPWVEIPPDIQERFWAYIDVRDLDECWPWTGGLFGGRYGQFRLGKRKVKAHRLAFVLYGGELSHEQPYVLHTCDFEPCCNFLHLFAGSSSDNAQDRENKGRGHHVPIPPRRGVDNHNAKLTASDVAAIRLRRSRGEFLREIASDFDVGTSTISSVSRGCSWAHLP